MSLPKERRREIILGAVLVVLGILAWQQMAGGGAGGTAGGRAAAGGRADISGLKVYDVQWAALSAPRPSYDPSGRNIFQFGVIPPPPPPVLTREEQEAIRKAQEAAEKARQEAEAAARKMQEEAQKQAMEIAEAQKNMPPPPPPRPLPPPINYKFIGYVGPPERKIAVLHDGTDFVFARQGDEVGKGLRILEIGYESIKFGFTDARFKGETQTLPMSSSY